MRKRLNKVIWLGLALMSLLFSPLKAEQTFEVGNGTFLLDGEPFVVKAAELHYPRIPEQYWEQRIQMCKALGMNTICLYVFWNFHEQQPGEYDFSGDKDLRKFIQLCQDNDMKVILRPGPYVCAEWEMGGLPWWLLKEEDILLRENDPRFMERVDNFQAKVAEQVADLTIDKGGPILMIQVENEYGSYGKDKPYVSAIRDILRKYYGEDVAMFQCDWESNFLDNGLDDLIWTMNFGTGANIDQQFRRLKEERPDSPLMCSEFWSGWFDKWGANHETRPASEMTAGIDEMLSKGISFSLYMTHGGTNWGHWAGANSPGFAPDVTSYDYDAPINEYGRPTEKYFLLRQTMERHNDGKPLPELPDTIPTISINRFAMTEVAPLLSNLPVPQLTEEPLSMEKFDQGFGSILYRTTIPAHKHTSVLSIDEAHDYARIFLNGKYIGSLDRRKGEKELILPEMDEESTLDILVEAMGRINFGRAIKDFKGIVGKVTLTNDGQEKELKGWETYCLPDEEGFYSSMDFLPIENVSRNKDGRFPEGVYRGHFRLDTIGDTFLNFENWGKGLVYVNGHPLGRIWEIGPQQTLYTPGCWLREGDNEIMIFDIIGPRIPETEGLRAPILDRLNINDTAKDMTLYSKLEQLQPVAEGKFGEGNGWQTVKFDSQASGRYLAIQALDAIDGGDIAAIAELYLLDEQGNRLSRESWRALFADSEDTDGANLTADKTFDLQESTSWTTAPGVPYPHTLIIDLGAETTADSLQYLPRMEKEVPGGVKHYRIFLF